MQRYLVFGRTAYATPLSYQGILEAPGPEEARRLALERYGRQWVELTLVPEPAVHWVLHEPASSKAAAEAVGRHA